MFKQSDKAIQIVYLEALEKLKARRGPQIDPKVWQPKDGQFGNVISVEFSRFERLRYFVLWEGAPNKILRPIDIWDDEIKIIGENKDVRLPIFQIPDEELKIIIKAEKIQNAAG